MAGFVHSRGPLTTAWFPKIASTAIAVGDLLYADLSGAVQPADSTSGNHIGVCQKAIASTDSDYADTTSIPVQLVGPHTFFRAEAAGTATTAMVLGYYDLTDANTVNLAAQSKNVVLVTKFISTTEVEVCVSASAFVVNVATT